MVQEGSSPFNCRYNLKPKIIMTTNNIDLRKAYMEGDLSNKVDVDEVYREICAHFRESVTKMKAFTDSQTAINENGLLKLCVHLGLKCEFDSLFDKFRVWYNPVDTKISDIKSVPDKVKKEEAPKKEPAPKVEKVKKEEVKEEEDDDLF